MACERIAGGGVDIIICTRGQRTHFAPRFTGGGSLPSLTHCSIDRSLTPNNSARSCFVYQRFGWG